MPQVTINNITYSAEQGEKLSSLLLRKGIYVPHICGGRGVCRKCLVRVNGEQRLSCTFEITEDITVEIPQSEDIAAPTPAAVSDFRYNDEKLCYILDIGSTTLALAVAEPDSGKIVDCHTSVNPQRQFGADVISRIAYCKESSVKPLTEVLLSEICALMKKADRGILPMYVTGNTTMLHTFFGEDISSMGSFPYYPKFTESRSVKGAEAELPLASEITSMPCLNTFAGADILSGVLSVGLAEKYRLLVDLGTNAEIVLFNKDRCFFTSAAAGPCFEGGSITCGVSAVKGAICSCKRENGRLVFETLSKEAPCGICSTGLIDIIACLLGNGEIDETGYMKKEQLTLCEDIYLTRQDIRSFQTAKSAVRCGIELLLANAKICENDLEGICISGGFSNGLNIESCIKTGLFPPLPSDRFFCMGNTALSGCVKFAENPHALNEILQKSQYVDLADNPRFFDIFINYMEF